MSILDAFYSLGSKVNKAMGRSVDNETEEGAISEKFPELKLEMENDEISKLVKKWESNWIESEVYKNWESSAKENENYWKGDQYSQPKVDSERKIVDNVIFESLETYLPQVTRRNPDPMVQLSRKEQQTPDNLKFASDIQKELGEIADEINFRLKLKKAARHWAIYLLGAIKIGWDIDKDIPTAKVIRAHKLILDPDSTIDEDGYSGDYVGEYRKLRADIMIEMLKSIGGEKNAENIIKSAVGKAGKKDNLGTKIGFIEWWTQEYMLWTIDNKVIMKKKNPHWNYDETSQVEAPYNEDGTPQLNEDGSVKMEESVTPGINHLPVPGMPYKFLSVFNLGKQPTDDTSLIGQNLSSQDLVNKRNRQIDKNADSMNGSVGISLSRSGMTKEQAAGVTEAVRKGGVIAIPDGNVNEAIVRLNAPSLPPDIYNQLADTRNRMRDIFGTRGSSAAGLESEKTVRGKLQNRVLDTDRIGGGFSEYLEQLADGVYNWMVQMLYVYDERFAGKGHPKIRISVKEGSLLPKDSLTLANQALELAGSNRMSLIDLYKALDYPNPEEMAANAWLEANAPEMLFANDPRIQQVLQSRKQPVGDVSKSISFKDLPPEGQAQLASQAGINLHPEAIATYNENKNEKERSIAEANKPTPAPQPAAQ